MFAEHTKAADFCLGRHLANDACNRGAMAIYITTLAGDGDDLMAFFDDCDIVGEGQALKKRMGTLDSRVQHSDLDVGAVAAAQERPGLINCRQRISPHSLQPTVQLSNFSSTSCDNTAVAL